MILYDYVDAREVNVMKQWAQGLQARDQGKLNNRLGMLEKVSDPITQLPGLLAGPGIDGESEIYKVQVGASGSEHALRPLACRGPFNKNLEITLLAGATERDGRLVPLNVAATAERCRQSVIADKRRRCAHERVPKFESGS
jgi:hypothetical protein